MKKGEIMDGGNIVMDHDTNRNMIVAALKYFDAPPINLKDPQQVHDRIIDYFQTCTERGLRPANLGLYSALGLSRQDVSDILRGANRSKVSPASIDTLKKARLALSTYRESLAMTGKINPVTAIFWGKNFDQMSDTTRIEVSRNDALSRAGMTPEQIAQKIREDIPIDTDYEEITDQED